MKRAEYNEYLYIRSSIRKYRKEGTRPIMWQDVYKRQMPYMANVCPTTNSSSRSKNPTCLWATRPRVSATERPRLMCSTTN